VCASHGSFASWYITTEFNDGEKYAIALRSLLSRALNSLYSSKLAKTRTLTLLSERFSRPRPE
jgi:hypothetical protein